MSQFEQLTPNQRDRAIGSILASAAGDALGAPYEFESPRETHQSVEMSGGGAFGWAPGEWTDDTQMAFAILQLLSAGNDLSRSETLDQLVEAWHAWSLSARDVGMQTRSVLLGLNKLTSDEAFRSSEEFHAEMGRSAGNGSLMRTGPVFLGSLDSFEATASNALSISRLTHWEQDAGEACVLWSLAIQNAVMNARLDIRFGLNYLPPESRDKWLARIEEAEAKQPRYFESNGWVVHAFQAAWSAIHLATTAPEDKFKFNAERLAYGLDLAVRAGNDTDTVAAIAGSLLGAYFGFTAVPNAWRLKLHGWPNATEQDLVRLVNTVLNGDSRQGVWPQIDNFDYSHWPDRFELVQHPADSGVWLGGVGSLTDLPAEVTAVVSLCRIGLQDVPDRIFRKLEIQLLDKTGREYNLNLGFTFVDVAGAIKQLRDEGETVFLHCVQSQSRTPAIATVYALKHLGLDAESALKQIQTVLPLANPIEEFMTTIREIEKQEDLP